MYHSTVGLYTRECEIRKSGPVTKLCGITANPNKHPMRGGRTIKNKQLMPAWWRYLRVGWCSYSADVTIARESREDGASAHDIAMSARRRCKERDAQCLTLEQLHRDLVLPAVLPVGVRHSYDGLGQSLA